MVSRELLCILVFLVLYQLVDCRRNIQKRQTSVARFLPETYNLGPPRRNRLTRAVWLPYTRLFSEITCFYPGTRLTLCKRRPWTTYFRDITACHPLQNPAYGRVDLTEGTNVNSVAMFSCYDGFNLYGPTTRTCMASGGWSDASPTCQKTGCDCDNKRAPTGISMPVNGGGDVLTRQQFNNIVVERYWVGVYDIIGKNDMNLGHLYEFRQTYSAQLARGNYANMFSWQPTRGSTGACNTVRSNIIPLNDNFAINNVIDLNDNRPDALFEIYISSCPDQYVWLFDCFDFDALKTGICPVDKTLLLLTVPETNNNVSMDDLPWDAITRDLYVNSQNTVAFCKQNNMEANYLLGANVCKPTGGQ